ncbi:MAG: hypothetical protein PCFJNLEI_00530 [Verrucomicrobiae bacterium]|nr:hypothetical protein [Verrucomicrobiae bacterium]
MTNSPTLQDGELRLTPEVLLFDENGPVAPQPSDVRVQFQPLDTGPTSAGRWRYRCRIEVSRPLRVEIRLLAHSPGAYHVIPGVLFGDNNLSRSQAGHFPNLTPHTAAPSCAPEWKFRTDRAAAPLAVAFLPGGGYLGIAGSPYVGGGIPTGLCAALPAAVGFSVGFSNAPCQFINKDTWGAPSAASLPAGAVVEFRLDLCLKRDVGREHLFALVRELYGDYYEPPRTNLTAETAMRAVSEMMVRDAWDPARRAFIAVTCKGLPGKMTERKVGGRAIAWVGGVNVAYPLLAASYRFGETSWRAAALEALDRVAGHKNPANGLFWDAFTEDWQPTVNYWWSGNTNRDRHSAYTNAEAAWYLLRAAALMESHGERPVSAWRAAALEALETILTLQRADGHLGYAYAVDRREVLDWEGFAGCWWAAALLLAHRLTGERRYLDAGIRGLTCYEKQVRTLDVWGTPMDTWKSNDEEGVLAFIRATRLAHELTGEPRFLEWLAFGAEYEFLWRYLYNTRPLAEPLASAGWHSCGGSLTSVSNPHIHPMGLLVAGDLRYLADLTGDRHVRQRLADSLIWALNCLELFPAKTGYGRFGWTGERYCASDGLHIAKWADGTPASTELGLNLWAAGAMLEGLLEGAAGQHTPTGPG